AHHHDAQKSGADPRCHIQFETARWIGNRQSLVDTHADCQESRERHGHGSVAAKDLRPGHLPANLGNLRQGVMEIHGFSTIGKLYAAKLIFFAFPVKSVVGLDAPSLGIRQPDRRPGEATGAAVKWPRKGVRPLQETIATVLMTGTSWPLAMAAMS